MFKFNESTSSDSHRDWSRAIEQSQQINSNGDHGYIYRSHKLGTVAVLGKEEIEQHKNEGYQRLRMIEIAKKVASLKTNAENSAISMDAKQKLKEMAAKHDKNLSKNHHSFVVFVIHILERLGNLLNGFCTVTQLAEKCISRLKTQTVAPSQPDTPAAAPQLPIPTPSLAPPSTNRGAETGSNLSADLLGTPAHGMTLVELIAWMGDSDQTSNWINDSERYSREVARLMTIACPEDLAPTRVEMLRLAEALLQENRVDTFIESATPETLAKWMEVFCEHNGLTDKADDVSRQILYRLFSDEDLAMREQKLVAVLNVLPEVEHPTHVHAVYSFFLGNLYHAPKRGLRINFEPFFGGINTDANVQKVLRGVAVRSFCQSAGWGALTFSEAKANENGDRRLTGVTEQYRRLIRPMISDPAIIKHLTSFLDCDDSLGPIFITSFVQVILDEGEDLGQKMPLICGKIVHPNVLARILELLINSEHPERCEIFKNVLEETLQIEDAHERREKGRCVFGLLRDSDPSNAYLFAAAPVFVEFADRIDFSLYFLPSLNRLMTAYLDMRSEGIKILIEKHLGVLPVNAFIDTLRRDFPHNQTAWNVCLRTPGAFNPIEADLGCFDDDEKEMVYQCFKENPSTWGAWFADVGFMERKLRELPDEAAVIALFDQIAGSDLPLEDKKRLLLKILEGREDAIPEMINSVQEDAVIEAIVNRFSFSTSGSPIDIINFPIETDRQQQLFTQLFARVRSSLRNNNTFFKALSLRQLETIELQLNDEQKEWLAIKRNSDSDAVCDLFRNSNYPARLAFKFAATDEGIQVLKNVIVFLTDLQQPKEREIVRAIYQTENIDVLERFSADQIRLVFDQNASRQVAFEMINRVDGEKRKAVVEKIGDLVYRDFLRCVARDRELYYPTAKILSAQENPAILKEMISTIMQPSYLRDKSYAIHALEELSKPENLWKLYLVLPKLTLDVLLQYHHESASYFTIPNEETLVPLFKRYQKVQELKGNQDQSGEWLDSIEEGDLPLLFPWFMCPNGDYVIEQFQESWTSDKDLISECFRRFPSSFFQGPILNSTVEFLLKDDYKIVDIPDRLKDFYNNEKYSDIQFEVDGDIVYAHKAVLRWVPFDFEDVSHPAFKVMLKFAYDGKMTPGNADILVGNLPEDFDYASARGALCVDEGADTQLISSEGTKIPAHRVLLEAFSDYFKGMASFEGLKEEIDLLDYSEDTLRGVVNYIYHPTMDQFDFESEEDQTAFAEILEGFLLLNQS